MLFLFLLANVLLTTSKVHFLEEIRAHWARGILAGAVLIVAGVALLRMG
jgi:hypothetical protein